MEQTVTNPLTYLLRRETNKYDTLCRGNQTAWKIDNVHFGKYRSSLGWLCLPVNICSLLPKIGSPCVSVYRTHRP